jgi:hypothetical protein
LVQKIGQVSITSGVPADSSGDGTERESLTEAPGTITLAEAGGASQLTAFVIMPFVEREQKQHSPGFFLEVLRSLITPAAKESFTVRTANRQGSDLIQSRMVKIFDRFEKAGLAATTSLFGLPSPPPR